MAGCSWIEVLKITLRGWTLSGNVQAIYSVSKIQCPIKKILNCLVISLKSTAKKLGINLQRAHYMAIILRCLA